MGISKTLLSSWEVLNLGKYKFLGSFFAFCTFVFSNVMCAVIAYNYCALEWGGEYAGYSAPPSTAFVLAIPWLLLILLSCLLSYYFFKKVQKNNVDKETLLLYKLDLAIAKSLNPDEEWAFQCCKSFVQKIR